MPGIVCYYRAQITASCIFHTFGSFLMDVFSFALNVLRFWRCESATLRISIESFKRKASTGKLIFFSPIALTVFVLQWRTIDGDWKSRREIQFDFIHIRKIHCHSLDWNNQSNTVASTFALIDWFLNNSCISNSSPIDAKMFSNNKRNTQFILLSFWSYNVDNQHIAPNNAPKKCQVN